MAGELGAGDAPAIAIDGQLTRVARERQRGIGRTFATIARGSGAGFAIAAVAHPTLDAVWLDDGLASNLDSHAGVMIDAAGGLELGAQRIAAFGELRCDGVGGVDFAILADRAGPAVGLRVG